MNLQMHCVIIDADNENRREMTRFMGEYGVNVTGQLPTLDTLGSLLGRADAPQLVICNLDPQPHETLKKIGGLPHQFPSIHFFVMSEVMDPNLMMEAMHLGIREFIPLPIPQEKFADALDRASQGAGMGNRGRVVHVIPTIGGCGSTTIACNIAASLATGGKAALIDLDLIRGGAAGYFDAKPRHTIADVMDTAETLDRQLLNNALTVHPDSKLSILARPELPEDTQRVTPHGLKRLVGVLGRAFDYVVMDSIMSIDPLYTAAIQSSDINLIVMQLNVPSAKNAERFVGALRRMGIESAKIRIVVNRFVKKGWDIDPQEVERSLGLKISWLIPNDFKNAIGAINYGRPVVLRAPRAEISTSLCGLAKTLHSKAA